MRINEQNEESEEDDEEEEIFYNSCFALNNLYGLMLSIFQLMILIIPYWADTDSAQSSHLLSDVRIFKGDLCCYTYRVNVFLRIFHRMFDSAFFPMAMSLSFIQRVSILCSEENMC